jgi:hypothetical protein
MAFDRFARRESELSRSYGTLKRVSWLSLWPSEMLIIGCNAGWRAEMALLQDVG